MESLVYISERKLKKIALKENHLGLIEEDVTVKAEELELETYTLENNSYNQSINEEGEIIICVNALEDVSFKHPLVNTNNNNVIIKVNNGEVNKQVTITSKCPWCDSEITATPSRVNMHMKKCKRIQMGANVFSCKICDSTFLSKNDLNKHSLIHSGDKPFKCEFCDFKCAQKGNLKMHMSKHSKEKPFHCPICGFEFSRKQHLKEHMMIHTGEKPYACNECPFRTKRFQELKKHLERHNKPKTLLLTMSNNTIVEGIQCKLCEFVCESKEILQNHNKEIHRRRREFFCDECEYTTSDPSNIRRHKNSHTGVKPLKRYQCIFCPRMFSQRQNLTAHLLTHTGEKPYSCPKCDFKSARSQSLKRHMFQHLSGDDKMRNQIHMCEVCGSSFHEKSNLKSHMAIHLGVKQFSCSICEYETHKGCNLKVHMLRHVNKKPLSCSECDYRCKHSSNLINHVMTKHTDDFPYSCPCCIEKFASEAVLLIHVEEEH